MLSPFIIGFIPILVLVAIAKIAQILVGVIKIYLFGSHLRFKSLYTFLGIKLYDLPLNL